MSMHGFDPEIAAEVGVVPAVLYQNIVFWVRKNAANGENFHDGKCWTFNSIKAWTQLFPYLTADQIRRALEKLEAADLVETGSFNKTAYDRTKWYCPIRETDLAETKNGTGGKPKPIPDSKPDITQIDSSSPSGDGQQSRCQRERQRALEHTFENGFWPDYPRKIGKGAARLKFVAQAKKHGLEAILEGLDRANKLWKRDATETQFIPHPATWLGQERWLDEPGKASKPNGTNGARKRNTMETPEGQGIYDYLYR